MEISGDLWRSLEIYGVCWITQNAQLRRRSLNDSNDLSETLLMDNLRLEQSPNLEIINNKYMTDGVQFYFQF